jgi:hypothetical protein
MRARTKGLLTATVVCALISQGCRERESEDGTTAQQRDKLTFSELMRSECRDTVPLNNRYFTPLGTWKAARHELEGILVVPEFVMRNSNGEADSAGPQDYFPGFAVAFFTHENYLLPTARETRRQ